MTLEDWLTVQEQHVCSSGFVQHKVYRFNDSHYVSVSNWVMVRRLQSPSTTGVSNSISQWAQNLKLG